MRNHIVILAVFLWREQTKIVTKWEGIDEDWMRLNRDWWNDGIMECCRLLVTGCWLLVTGYWLLVAGYWLLVAGCRLLDTGYWLLVAGLEVWSLEVFAQPPPHPTRESTALPLVIFLSLRYRKMTGGGGNPQFSQKVVLKGRYFVGVVVDWMYWMSNIEQPRRIFIQRGKGMMIWDFKKWRKWGQRCSLIRAGFLMLNIEYRTLNIDLRFFFTVEVLWSGKVPR